MRLRRIEGQVRGLQKMVEEDMYCIDILTQVSAATRALQSVALGLVKDHLGHCVTQAAAEGGEVAAGPGEPFSPSERARGGSAGGRQGGIRGGSGHRGEPGRGTGGGGRGGGADDGGEDVGVGAARIEKKLNKLDGVAATVNFA